MQGEKGTSTRKDVEDGSELAVLSEKDYFVSVSFCHSRTVPASSVRAQAQARIHSSRKGDSGLCSSMKPPLSRGQALAWAGTRSRVAGMTETLSFPDRDYFDEVWDELSGLKRHVPLLLLPA